jgi:hypothetical protein
MHLTPVPSLAMSASDRISEGSLGISRSISLRSGLPRLLGSIALARRLHLPGLRREAVLDHEARSALLSTMSTACIDHGRHVVRRYAQAAEALVRSDLAYYKPEIWGKRFGDAADLGFRQLSYRVELAAKTPARDGSSWARSIVWNGRSGRDIHWWRALWQTWPRSRRQIVGVGRGPRSRQTDRTHSVAARCCCQWRATRARRGANSGSRQHRTHRWLERLLRIEGTGLPTRNRSADTGLGKQSVALVESRCRIAEALAARNSSGRCSTKPSGLLLGRIHVPLQPPHFRFARAAVLPTFGSGSTYGAGVCPDIKRRDGGQISYRRQVHSPITLIIGPLRTAIQFTLRSGRSDRHGHHPGHRFFR